MWTRLRQLAVFTALIFTILYAMSAKADEVYLTGAVGVFNSGKSSLSETKYTAAGYRTSLGWFKQDLELGGWIDRVPGRSGSAYSAYQVGWEVDGPMIMRVMTGPAFISTTDEYLGGHFQLKDDFYLGIKDTEGRTMGVKYNHISSAGIETPNIGRDFFGLEIGLSF
jgi:Lipid A 3-O-deacylase (PagL)